MPIGELAHGQTEVATKGGAVVAQWVDTMMNESAENIVDIIGQRRHRVSGCRVLASAGSGKLKLDGMLNAKCEPHYPGKQSAAKVPRACSTGGCRPVGTVLIIAASAIKI
jgi:hypothetical protein